MDAREGADAGRIGTGRPSAQPLRPGEGVDDPAELGGRAMLLNFALWTLFATLQASNWLVAPHTDWDAYAEVSVIRSVGSAFVNAYMWALLTPRIFRIASRFDAEREARVWRLLMVLALGLGLSALLAAVATATHRLLVPALDGAAPPRTVLWSFSRWYFQEIATFAVVFLAGLTYDVARRYRVREHQAARLLAEAGRLQTEQAELRARAAQLQAESAELETQLAEARLAVLRTRLNPHFLFNTLNAVSALVARDPRGVRDMIALLSELLRHALTDSREQEISLREEVRLLRLYLDILEIRYQGLLVTVVAVDDEVEEALVPNLVLQPLVENAVKHAIDRAGGHGTIEVRAYRSGDDLVLSVRDTGPGESGAAPDSESGVGLRLTRERLAEIYGDQQRLELEPVAGGGMQARVILPYHTSDDVRIANERM
jgi:two-component system, LytTR family, sensor kinase